MQPVRTLVFVYNLDSGVLPKIKDYAATAPAPEPDGCRLFTLTNSPIGMKKEWKRFVKDLGMPARFLPRNEFVREFGQVLSGFPAVLVHDGTELALLISRDEINRCQDLDELIRLVRQRIGQIT